MPTIDTTEGLTLTVHMPCHIGVVRSRGGKLRLYVSDEWETLDDVKAKVGRQRAKLDAGGKIGEDNGTT